LCLAIAAKVGRDGPAGNGVGRRLQGGAGPPPHRLGNPLDPGAHLVPNTPVTVVETRALRKTYEAEEGGMPVRALRGVDLAMGAGEFVAVMGPSGCGKSTLLNLIAGLDTPTGGEVLLAGESLAGRSEDELARLRRRNVGVVFQFFNLLEGMTVLENVALAAVAAGSSRRRAETGALELLDLLGLADRARLLPGPLSGGQRQRLAIARALANRPTVLLADEPTGALDSAGGDEVLELFRALHGSGQTILLVTHDEHVAAPAERVVHMRDGRLIGAVAPRAAAEA
jgi:putative ABC transport system ATP-binding protein